MVSPLSIPQSLGPYDVLSVLGQGGMGVVLKARHRELGTLRALKVLPLRGDAADGRRMARFEREVQTLAKLRHPAVIAVHDSGREGNQLWFAMDLIDGKPLDRLLAETRLSFERAAELALKIARGVHCLHAAGVVHRDLKPGNVVLTPNGEPVVLDLGLVLGEDDQRLTRTGALVGTLAYMAPEQIGGGASPRTDVYALGLMAFELFTGVMWTEVTGGVGSGTALLSLITKRDRPLPSSADPDLPRNVDALVARATQRDPALRYPDAGALADALEALTPGGLTRRSLHRALGVGAVLALSLLLGLASLFWTAPAQSAGPGTETPGDAAARAERAARDRLRAGDTGLASLRALETRAARLDAATAWLREFPEHPKREDVTLFLREEALAGPRRVIEIEGRPQGVLLAGNRALVSGNKRPAAELFDLESGALLASWPQAKQIGAVARTADGQGAVLLTNGALTVLDAAGRKLGGPHALGVPCKRLALSPDGTVACVAGASHLRLVRLSDGATLHELSPLPRETRRLAFSEDGAHLLVGAGDDKPGSTNGVLVYSVASGKQIAFLHQRIQVESLTVGSGLLVTGSMHGQIRLYDFAHCFDTDPEGDGQGLFRELRSPKKGSSHDPVAANQLKYTREGRAHAWLVRALALSPDGRVLYSAAASDVEQASARWDVESGARLHHRERRPEDIQRSLDVSRDGRRLMVCADGRIEVWELVP